MVDNVTFMEVPPNIDDPVILKRFLGQLLENLDKAFGNRGNTGFVDASGAVGISSAITDEAFSGQIFSNVKRYSQDFNFTNDRDLIDRAFVLANSSENEAQPAVADVAYAQANPGVGYAQGEAITVDNGVDANANKINEILTALRDANILEV